MERRDAYKSLSPALSEVSEFAVVTVGGPTAAITWQIIEDIGCYLPLTLRRSAQL
jgi:hypothetical protein